MSSAPPSRGSAGALFPLWAADVPAAAENESWTAGRWARILTDGFRCHTPCACRKSNPDILVVQSTQDRTAENASSSLNGSRRWRILVQR